MTRHNRPDITQARPARVHLWDGRNGMARVVDGLPAWGYRYVPAGLATRRQLAAAGKRPGGQKPYAVLIWRGGQRWARLYRIDLAKPKRQPTQAMLAALERANTARRTCTECDTDTGTYLHPASRLCNGCDLNHPANRQRHKGDTAVPIRPDMRDRYPADWPQISIRIRFDRAQGRCECTGECGRPHVRRGSRKSDDPRCAAVHEAPHPVTGSWVVLTTAHLNHTPEDSRDDNLKAMCQRCHLNYDAAHHAANAARTRAAKKAAGARLAVREVAA